MLKVLNMVGNHFSVRDTGEDLFKKNPRVQFLIQAPVYWWIDTDWCVYSLALPTNKFEFCLDGWPAGALFPQSISDYISHTKKALTPRQLMQILPMSVYIDGIVSLTYREIVEVCENYIAGEYKYVAPFSFPNEREWKDFCETLLDIRGVRDLIQEET